MNGNRRRSWAVLTLVGSLLLASCLSAPIEQALRGNNQPAASQVAIQVETTPFNTPVFGFPTGVAAEPTETPPAQKPASPAATPAQAAANLAKTGDFDAAVPVAWFNLAYGLARDGRLPPPLSSRLFGYAGVALYEAVAPGIPGSRSLAGQLNELQPLPQPISGVEYHWPAVANAALATLFRTSFANAPGNLQRTIEDLERQFEDQFASTVAPDVLERSIAHGQIVGLAIFKWAQSDGFAYLNNCAYTAPSGPGLWEPTPPGFAAALQPCWGQMRPFVLRERSDECQPTVRPKYSEDPSSPFYIEAQEVYQTSQNLTPEQQEIARFWADDAGKTGTPPGHILSILTQLVQQQQLPLDVAAEAYARVGVAVADSFISCWQTKFVTNVPRPITYIRKLFDPAWTSTIATPPFPEYTSGHSVQSGAAAAVLTAMFGDDVAFTDHTHDALGLAPRSFNSFREMANEAAISRLYGGIHYRSAIDVGLVQGQCIGQRVNALKFSK